MSRAGQSKAPFIQLGSGDAQYFIALTGRSLAFALGTWPLSHRWRWVERLLRYAPVSSTVLRAILPSFGFAIHKAKSKPLVVESDWNDREMVVATSWRGQQGATTIFLFEADERSPSVVAKLAPSSRRAALRNEADKLDELGPGARMSGAQVPAVIRYSESEARCSLLLSCVPGRPASMVLRERPGAIAGVVGDISGWLNRWNAATAHQLELTAEHYERFVLEPARAVAPDLESGAAYLDWLADACRRLSGRAVPFVCAHNDLTMSNILIAPEAPIGVVDWEEARLDGLPLADFWYSACDALLAAGHRDRLHAFAECFPTNSDRGALITSYESELRSVVGGPPEWLDLCFHACWMQHAANEQARPAGDDRPFLAIANRISKLALECSG